MINISDFNSLWEIAFAINAIFVYFELTPVLERKFNGINAIGSSIINKLAEEEDRRYINTYGWRSALFGYSIWVARLKNISALNSLVAIILIIIAGLSPGSTLGVSFTTIIILILFTPILAIPAILIYVFPAYKLKCIEKAVYEIIERECGNSKALTKKQRRYQIAVEYIKLTEFPFSPFVKRNKLFSNEEIFAEVDE
jgi:hypothetical protein